MMDEFFVVQQTYTDYAQALRDDNQMITRRCPVCGAIFSDRRFDKFRVHFSGKKEGDFYFAPICIIVSEKFLKVLYENNITGFSTREINCTGWYNKRGQAASIDASKYKELVVNGRTGYLLDKNGKEIPRCLECGAFKSNPYNKINGLSVGDEWDGSDVFYFKNWEGPLIVTRRTKELLEENKLKNVKCTAVEEYIL